MCYLVCAILGYKKATLLTTQHLRIEIYDTSAGLFMQYDILITAYKSQEQVETNLMQVTNSLALLRLHDNNNPSSNMDLM